MSCLAACLDALNPRQTRGARIRCLEKVLHLGFTSRSNVPISCAGGDIPILIISLAIPHTCLPIGVIGSLN
jgi:hypothetical protein